MPVVTLKSQARRNVTKVPTFGPRKSVRSTGPVGGMTGALVVNWSCDVRRVAKLPSEPRGDAYQIRQAKYVDSSHSNTRTSQGALGQGVAALQIHLCKGIVKSYRTPALHGLAPFPRTSNPKRHKNNRFPKCPNPCLNRKQNIAESCCAIVLESLVCEFGNLECTSPSGLASRTYAANVACHLFAFVPSSVGCANSQID